MCALKVRPCGREQVVQCRGEFELGTSERREIAPGLLLTEDASGYGPRLGSAKPWRRYGLAISAVSLAIVVAACSRGGNSRDTSEFRSSGSQRASIDPKLGTSPSPRVVELGQRPPKGGGSFKIGSPYKVAGRWYVPTEDPRYDRQGIASWYGADFHGRKTANGEIYDMHSLTAAHPTLPLPSYVYVTNLANNRTVLVRVNDRGPYAHDRVIDLSKRTAQFLGSERGGLTQVRVRYAGRAPLDGNDMAERRFLAQQSWARPLMASHEQPPSQWGTRMSLGIDPSAVALDR